MELNLAGRTALVTGGGTGLGQAIALALAQYGADVAITYYSSAQTATQTVQAIEALGRKACALQLDGTQVEQVNQVVPQAAERLGGHIDILVNNAGHMVARVPFAEMTDAYWHQVMAVNVDSAFYVTRATLPYMQQGWGRIVFMSSLAGRNGGGRGSTAYATSKAALLGLTRGLAKEMAPRGITVNALAPGLILETNFHATFTSLDAQQAMIAGIPLGRGGVPDEVAGPALYLCSDLASFVTGEVLEINGGAWVI